MKRIIVGVALFVATASAVLVAQSSRKVTVVTTKGDTIEGTVRSMSADQIVVELAGQPIPIATADIKYISFVGRIESPGPTGVTTDPMEKAFESLRTLRAVAQVGVLRDQYSAKLIEHLPAVQHFITSTEDWKDVRRALELSVSAYKEPMEDLLSWGNAGRSMSWGVAWAEYAELLSRRPNESSHVETESTAKISVPGTVKGRVGFGDAMMPETLDKSNKGSYRDVVELTVPTKTSLEITMDCIPCEEHLLLTDAAGKKVAAPIFNEPHIRKTLNPGTYNIWVGGRKSQIGEYTLTVKPR